MESEIISFLESKGFISVLPYCEDRLKNIYRCDMQFIAERANCEDIFYFEISQINHEIYKYKITTFRLSHNLYNPYSNHYVTSLNHYFNWYL